MLECKDKEQAVLHLFRLYGLCGVDPRALRPPAEVETLHTNGRKSTKRARAKAAKEAVEADGADAEEEEVKEEVKREAEEHGIPARETKAAVEETLEDGGLECGSGDEEPEVEDVKPVVKAKRGRKPNAVKMEDDEGEVKQKEVVPAKGRTRARSIMAPKRGRTSVKREAV